MGKATRRKTSHIAGLFEIFFVFIILFSLSPANGQTTGSILGYVFESGTTTPISGVSVQAYSSSTGAGDHTTTDATGKYTISGLPAGDYYLVVYPAEGQNYIAEYYDNKVYFGDVVPDPVTVTTGADTPVDFYLDKGATISGTVSVSGSPTTYIADARVWAIEYNSHASRNTKTDVNGFYTVIGLSAAEYYIYVSTSGQNYVGEYYDNKASFSEADLVNVLNAGDTITGKDFSLDPGATISGRVTNSSGKGIADVWVDAYSATCYNGEYLGYGETDADGYYTIIGLPAGATYLEATAYGQYYIGEWYKDAADAASCEYADSVTVAAGGTQGEINFQLEMGGAISGTVYESDGTTPVAYSQVLLLSDPCYTPGASYLSVTFTDDSGEYSFSGLAAGEVYVLAYGTMPDVGGTPEYIRNWYNNVFSCEEVDPVTVTVGADTGGIDFMLYPSTDSDNDNMPDQWEIEYFGNTSMDGSGDTDDDGVSDVNEYTAGTAPVEIETDTDTNETEDDDGGGGGGGGGGGIFGAININEVTGYHLDGIKKNGTRIYMPVTNGYKALKGAQTHIEKFAPVLANIIRGGFDSLERIAEANKGGLLYRFGTHAYPILGKVAELYLDVVGSQELMTNAYSGTMISVTEFDKQHQQGIAISPHIVKHADKEEKKR